MYSTFILSYLHISISFYAPPPIMPSSSGSSISPFTEDLKDDSSSIIDLKADINEDVDFPPVDGGPRAWAFLFGAFMVEGLLHGKSSFV